MNKHLSECGICHRKSEIVRLRQHCPFCSPELQNPMKEEIEETQEIAQQDLGYFSKENWQLPKKYKFIAEDYQGFEEDLKKELETARREGRQEILKNIGNLRQYLNEDHNCSPMVTNEDIEFWLLGRLG